MSGVARATSRNSPSMVWLSGAGCAELAQVRVHKFSERAHVAVTGVERRHVAQLLPTRVSEALRIAERDLLERLDAVGGEAGADHVHGIHAAARQLLESLFRVRLEPFCFPETGLEHEFPFLLTQAELLREQPRSGLALAAVGVARVRDRVRDAVEGDEELAGPAAFAPMLLHALGE